MVLLFWQHFSCLFRCMVSKEFNQIWPLWPMICNFDLLSFDEFLGIYKLKSLLFNKYTGSSIPCSAHIILMNNQYKFRIVRNHVKLGVSPRILYCAVDTGYGLGGSLWDCRRKYQMVEKQTESHDWQVIFLVPFKQPGLDI